MTRIPSPTKNRVVLKQKEGESVTPSGIILPGQQREPQIGIVQYTGPEVETDGSQKIFQPGDEVLYAKYAGTEVKIDDEEYIVLDADDILAVLQEELLGVEEEE